MLPRELASRFALSPAEMFFESDAWTRELFAMGEAVQGRMEGEVARTVVDLNRDPGHRPPNHPDGVIKSLTAYGRRVWTDDGFPSPEEVERLLDRYHRPYHENLARIAGRGGVRLALDCHSVAATGPPQSPDAGEKRPVFNLCNCGDETGEGPEVTAPAALLQTLAKLLEAEFPDLGGDGVQLVQLNRPHSGGYTLRRHGRGHTPWVQFDVNRAIYLQDEDQSVVPDSDRELIASLRRRLFRVMGLLAEALE